MFLTVLERDKSIVNGRIQREVVLIIVVKMDDEFLVKNSLASSPFFHGLLASLSTDLLLHPLDNLKCIAQTRGLNRGLSGVGFSVRGIYRGLPAVALAGAPANGVFFSVYETCKDSLGEGRAAGVGSFAASLVYAPMETVKESAFVDSVSTRKALIQNRSKLYRGWLLSNLTWIPYLSLYYTMYERLKGSNSPNLAASSSVGAGIFAAFVTYPIDVVKTRVQSGFTGCGVKTLRAHGIGLFLRVLWLAPNSAMNVTFYEFWRAHLAYDSNALL